MYDPNTARFTSQDPLGFAAGDPNLYRYVGNSSTNYTDPSGMLESKTPIQLATGPNGLKNRRAELSQAGLDDLLADLDLIERYWDTLPENERQAINGVLGRPAMLDGWMKQRPNNGWKFNDPQAELHRLLKEDPQKLANLQLATLRELAKKWEAEEQKKLEAQRIAEHNDALKLTITNLEWQLDWVFVGDAFRWFAGAVGVKDAALAAARSDAALLQWLGVDLSQFKPSHPDAQAVLKDVHGAYQYAIGLGLTDPEARRYAAYLYFAGSRWHANACEAIDGVSLHPGEDFGRRLSLGERLLRGLDAALDFLAQLANANGFAGNNKPPLTNAEREFKEAIEKLGKQPAKTHDDVTASINRMAGASGNLPAAKHWDWDHILSAHTEGGLIAGQRNRPEQIFQGLTNDQVKGVCQRAWSERKKLETQGTGDATRIRFQGTDPETGRVVEFWYNPITKTVDTAYPVRVK